MSNAERYFIERYAGPSGGRDLWVVMDRANSRRGRGGGSVDGPFEREAAERRAERLNKRFGPAS